MLLDDTAAQLVERSRHTNVLHARVIDAARQIEAACKDGIADDLDPNCVAVFQKSLIRSYEIMKLSMTEMQGHMSKGKWGYCADPNPSEGRPTCPSRCVRLGRQQQKKVGLGGR